MGTNQSWNATRAFQKYRQKINQLSRIYWVTEMASASLDKQLSILPPDEAAALALESPFDLKMYRLSVKETQEFLPTLMDRNRLYLLVIHTAFLESYLKEITLLHLAAEGYWANPEEITENVRLNPVGKALGAPILDRSTVPEMLKFAAHLFNLDFGEDGRDWVKNYKIRCEVAHNGGVATVGFLKEIGGLKMELNPRAFEMLGLTWEELRKSMRTADNIAAAIDTKLSSYSIRLVEHEFVLRELLATKQLPKESKLWNVLFEEYGLRRLKKQDRPGLVKKFYPKKEE